MELKRVDKINILLQCGCTKNEAEKYLNNGTIIYTDLEENLDLYKSECYTEEQAEELETMVENGIPAPDWDIVEYNGKKYYVCYVL